MEDSSLSVFAFDTARLTLYGIPYKNNDANGSLLPRKKPDAQLVLDSIRQIVRSLRTFSKTTERDIGLSTAQIFVLQKLMEAGRALSVNELARATLTHQSSVSVVVSKLVERKLIERAADKNDSRSVKLSLTKQGEYLLGKSPASIQERLTKALAKMDKKERAGLVEGLRSLVELAGMEHDEVPMLMEETRSNN